METSIRQDEMARFFPSVPRKEIMSQRLAIDDVRKIFERRYRKRKAEMEALSPMEECGQGRVEDDKNDVGVEKKPGIKCGLVRW